VAVKERRGPAGELTGYAVAWPDPTSGEVVFYGGGRLVGDLSLPKLQARWDPTSRPPAASTLLGGAGRAAMWQRATSAAADAAERTRLAVAAGDPAAAADAAWATAAR